MINIIKDLDQLNDNELYELREILDMKIKIHEKLKMKNFIKNEIEEYGHAFLVPKFESMDASEISTEYDSRFFPLNIEVYTYDLKQFRKIHVGNLDNKQNDWFRYMAYDYVPNDEDLPKIKNIRWDNLAHEYDLDHENGVGIMDVKIIYKKNPPPLNDNVFDCFDNVGNIKTWNVTNNMLYCQGIYFGTLDKWYTYDLFVVKYIDDTDIGNESDNNDLVNNDVILLDKNVG